MIVLLGGGGVPATAQDAEEPTADVAADESAPAAEEQAEPDDTQASDEAVAEPLPDDEFYQDIDDEDFRPSEDIPADQSIPFPSDI